MTYDGPFWRTRSPLERIDRVRAPTMIFGAVDDIFQRDEPLLYEALRAQGVDSRLVIYPGNHVSNFLQAFIGNDQIPAMHYLMIQWFDHYLKGIDSGIDALPPVIQHVKHYPSADTPDSQRNDSYITAATWPHPLARAERWYLRGDKTLTRAPAQVTEPVHTMATPESPIITYGKTGGGGFLSFELGLRDGTECSPMYDQWTLGIKGLTKPRACYRNSATFQATHLNYESAPMSEDMFINGPLQADVWITSNVTDAVISVRVDEVSPDGRQVSPITGGLLLASVRAIDERRARYLDGQMIQPYHWFTEERQQPIVPGEPTLVRVELFPTSALIRRGYRMRVAIGPSNQAQGFLNLPRQARMAGGVTTLLHSPQYPSSVVVPTVPLSALN